MLATSAWPAGCLPVTLALQAASAFMYPQPEHLKSQEVNGRGKMTPFHRGGNWGSGRPRLLMKTPDSQPCALSGTPPSFPLVPLPHSSNLCTHPLLSCPPLWVNSCSWASPGSVSPGSGVGVERSQEHHRTGHQIRAIMVTAAITLPPNVC